MADPIKLTLDAATEIEGREDTIQLAVRGHVTQTEPLQTWEDHSGDAVAEMSGDGLLQLDDRVALTAISVSGTPATNLVWLYAKSDGKLYLKDWNDNERDLTGGGGGDAPADFFDNLLVNSSGATIVNAGGAPLWANNPGS